MILQVKIAVAVSDHDFRYIGILCAWCFTIKRVTMNLETIGFSFKVK
jgi:hypothetical protein